MSRMLSQAVVNEITVAERARIQLILESPEGLARPTIAREFALRTGMEADQVLATLRNIPAENPLAAALASEALGVSPAIASSAGLIGEDAKTKRQRELEESASSYARGQGYKG